MNAKAICAPALPVRASVRPRGNRGSNARVQQKTTVATQATPVEFVQVANEAAFIGGVAGTMISMTLIGLALGFVLLRVESLVEEGKLQRTLRRFFIPQMVCRERRP
eukprot:TRINITY_DN2648_c0_g1_i10.p4 TRINITY_DN2648_c0_g1~~TRINITY_DN2648_c0_g1_i10.p4  ORF type:complete len:107 (+),score=9.35 TRINITY_DN2648_c0_g1_i10:124-444(+)